MKKIILKLIVSVLLLPVIVGWGAEPFWLGVNFHFGTSASGDVDANLNLFEHAGLNAGRDGRQWRFVEWNKGELRYFKNGHIDRMFSRLHDQGGCYINVLAYGHPAYCGDKKMSNTQEAIEAFCRYAEFVTGETKGKAAFQEVWNEWDLTVGDSLESHRDYVKLLSAVAPRIRAADPSVKILSSSATMHYKLENLLKAGVLKHIDALSLHPYVAWRGRGKDTVEFWYSLMQRMDKTIRKYNHGKSFPVYITEIGWPTSIAAEGFTEEMQAVYAAQMLCLIRTLPYIKGLLWYDFQDDNVRPDDKEANFGLIRVDTTPKPAYYVFADLSELVRNGEFVKRINVNDPKVWILHYRLNGDDVYAMWNYYLDRNTQIVLRNEAETRTPISVRHAGRSATTMEWGRRDWLHKKPRQANELAFTLRDMPLLLRGDLSKVRLTKIETIQFPRELPTQK